MRRGALPEPSLPAGVLALWVLVTHVMYMQDYWRTWLKGLRGFFFVGVLFSAVSVATFCTFLVLAVTGHQSKGLHKGRAWEGRWVEHSGGPGFLSWVQHLRPRDWTDHLTSLCRSGENGRPPSPPLGWKGSMKHVGSVCCISAPRSVWLAALFSLQRRVWERPLVAAVCK